MKARFTFLFLLTAVSAGAQDAGFPPINKNAFKVNLLSPIFNTVNVSYQRLITPEKSFQLGGSYMDFDDFLSDNGSSGEHRSNRIKGFNLIAEYRINFTGYGLNGFYGGPFLRYMNYTRDYEYRSGSNPGAQYTLNGKFQSMGLGFIVGKQFLIKNMFTIDLFAGPVYQILLQNSRTTRASAPAGNFYYYDTDYTDSYLGYIIPNGYLKGYSLRAGVNIGFAF